VFAQGRMASCLGTEYIGLAQAPPPPHPSATPPSPVRALRNWRRSPQCTPERLSEPNQDAKRHAAARGLPKLSDARRRLESPREPRAAGYEPYAVRQS